jgi:2-methylcitrate dehydratase PrpD
MCKERSMKLHAFIRALALGSEVAARLQSLLGHYGTQSQFTASVGSALGAAVVAGLLLGLDAGQLEDALGLAASGACGLSSHPREPLHQIKSLNHGRAAEVGVLSALLAQEGFHGPTEVLTIEHGFFDAFLGLPSVGHEVVDGLGEQYRSGEVLRQDLRYPLMTEAELQQKFRDLVGLRLESRRVADLERQLKGIESMENVAPLIRALELDS